MRKSILWLCLGTLGCPQPEPYETGETETGISDQCSPPLTLTPAFPATLPLNSIEMQVTGGTGQYVFSLVASDSPAIVNAATGTYLAGSEVGHSDEVQVVDLGCEGSATTAVSTIEGFEVVPTKASILPNTSITPLMEGGSGVFSCELLLAGTGATLNTCEYTAGSGTGEDIMRITDDQTGQTKDISIRVDPHASLGLLSNRVLLPLGAEYIPNTSGGTGIYDFEVLQGTVSLADGKIVGTEEGLSRVQITDRYAGFQEEITIATAAGRSPVQPPDGEAQNWAKIVGPGDLNGDGYPDAVVGSYEGALHQYYGGLLSVYAGTAEGLSIETAQSLGGKRKNAQYARDFAIADFNGDGEKDLAIGANNDWIDLTSSGMVYVHDGLAGDFFEATPSAAWESAYGYDRLGFSMVACNLNGDAYDDLVVTSYAAEDRTASSTSSNQGAMMIHLGTPAGLQPIAEDYRWGKLPHISSFLAAPYLYLGTSIEAGDINGDGLCDVVVASSVDESPGTDAEGIAFVYLGTESADEGLEDDPAFVITLDPVSGDGDLTRNMAIGDFDDDGKDDLALAAWKADEPPDSTNAGLVAVFLGSSLEVTSPFDGLTTEDADWLLYGNNSYDYFGFGITTGDVSGDGIDDLLVGAPQDELPGFPSTMGVIHAFTGSPTFADTYTPAFQWVGEEGGGFFGNAIGVIGDVTDNGDVEVMTLATRSSAYGTDSGAPFSMSYGSELLNLHEYDHKSAGHYFGSKGTITLTDVDQDGTLDVIMGGYGAGGPTGLYNQGRVYAYLRDEGSLSTEPLDLGITFPEYGTSSGLGVFIQTIPDFNGDGTHDLLALARDESRPEPLSSLYKNPKQCPGPKVNGGGAAYIFTGTGTGFSTNPVFAFFGPYTYDDLSTAETGLDVNGDGYLDVLVASEIWNASKGGFTLIRGGQSSLDELNLLCDTEQVDAIISNGQFGFAVTGLGDLNSDGCDDFAVSSPKDTLENDSGAVRVIWGWGGADCPATPEATTLITNVEDSFLGYALESLDIDGDSLSELIIGAPEQDGVGTVWVVPGASLHALNRDAITGGVLPTPSPESVYHLDELPNTFALSGTVPLGQFGTALATLPHPDEPGGYLAVGVPGAPAGAALVFRFSPEYPQGHIVAEVAGETHQPGGRLGSAFSINYTDPYWTLLVGAEEYDDELGVDVGGAYPFVLEELP